MRWSCGSISARTALTWAGESLGGQIFNGFTLRDGRIVRTVDYFPRAEALTAAGVTVDKGWY